MMALCFTNRQRGTQCYPDGKTNENANGVIHPSGHSTKTQAFSHLWMPYLHPGQQAPRKSSYSKMASKVAPWHLFGTVTQSLTLHKSDFESSYRAHLATISRET